MRTKIAILISLLLVGSEGLCSGYPRAEEWSKGHAAYESKHYKAARIFFEQVLASKPKGGAEDEMAIDAEIFAGLSSLRLGDASHACAAFAMATKRYGIGQAATYPTRAFFYWSSGNEAKAVQTYLGYINEDGLPVEVNDSHAAHPLFRALNELKAAQPSAAVGSAREAVNRDPTFKIGYFVLGLARLSLKDRVGARNDFVASLEKQGPQPPDTFLADAGFAAYDSIAYLCQ